MKAIGWTIELRISRQEANFDRACDEAYRQAVSQFEIDEGGHSTRIRDWERSRCWIELRFLSYIRIGSSHCYIFEATTAKASEGE